MFADLGGRAPRVGALGTGCWPRTNEAFLGGGCDKLPLLIEEMSTDEAAGAMGAWAFLREQQPLVGAKRAMEPQ